MGDPKDQETSPPAQGFQSFERAGGDGPDKTNRDDRQKANSEFSTLRAVVQAVDDPDLIASQVLILTVLYLAMRHDGYCEINYELIAKKSKISISTVARQLPILEKEGWIKRTRKFRIYRFEPGRKNLT